MGLAGLTAVFGMGTGVAPPVWSPENRPAGGQAGRARFGGSVTREALSKSNEPIRDHCPILAPLLWRGGRIGVVKLLGC